MSDQRAWAWPPDPGRLGLTWLSDPSTQVMPDLGIELKKIEKKREKKRGKIELSQNRPSFPLLF